MNDLSLLDSNIILRFLIEDNLSQLKKVDKILRLNKFFYIHDVILSETIWVAVKFYKIEKSIVVSMISNLIELPNVFCDKNRILTALDFWERNNKISFVDAYLLACGLIDKNETIYTFDKGILATKFNEVKVLEP